MTAIIQCAADFTSSTNLFVGGLISYDEEGWKRRAKRRVEITAGKYEHIRKEMDRLVYEHQQNV
jgi:hypothetical protein